MTLISIAVVIFFTTVAIHAFKMSIDHWRDIDDEADEQPMDEWCTDCKEYDWERLLEFKVCPEIERKETIDALKIAIIALREKEK